MHGKNIGFEYISGDRVIKNISKCFSSFHVIGLSARSIISSIVTRWQFICYTLVDHWYPLWCQRCRPMHSL